MPIHGFPGNVISATPPSVTPAGASGVFTTEQQMQYQTAGNWPMAATQISRSLRFNSADSAYLNRTPASAGNRKTWTWSGWVKRGKIDSDLYFLFSANPSFAIRYENNVLLINLRGDSTNYFIDFVNVYRDPSAWYHLVFACDTTQVTSTNRFKAYVNGVQLTTNGSYNSYPPQNYDTGCNTTSAHYLGRNGFSDSYWFDGYITEVNFIDGYALTPASFGQTNSNTGIWEPRQYTGPYGTNGFYLNFSDNSGTTSTTLGKDSSGNGNNWTPNNFSVTAGAGNDSLVDTPTSYGTDTGAGGEVRGNYCTLNPLDSGVTVVNGNLDFVYVAANRSVLGTVGMRTGKFRWEFTPSAANNNFDLYAGVIKSTSSFNKNANECRYNAGAYAVAGLYGGSTQVRPVNNNTFGTLFGWTWTNGDILGLYFDATNGTLKANQNGGSLVTVYTGLTTGIDWLPVFSDGSISSATHVTNFGQRPFAYASAESGYQALCTQNLPTPTIGATSTTQAGKYMNVVLYTGDGNNGRSITGVGFQTDFNWTKSRSSGSYFHQLSDAVRGFDKYLYSNATNAEGTDATNHIQSVNSDGYVINSGASFNANTVTYVAWNWNAGGSNATNTSGTITSTVRANTTAGFSIVTYTGNGSSATIGHGLGVAPSMYIVKRRDGVSDWSTWHTSLSGGSYYVNLNTTAAQASNTVVFPGATPTSTVVSVGTSISVNAATYVAYCFAPVAGYSAFGSYTGNGSTDGPFVYLGFRPRWVMFRNSGAVSNWWIYDTSRNTYNVMNLGLRADLADAEYTYTFIDCLSNGFKLRNTGGDGNANGGTIIYAAFAESPFKYALAR